MLPERYFIDDRPGEEMTATAVTPQQIAALLQVCPFLREVTREEYLRLEARIAELDGDDAY